MAITTNTQNISEAEAKAKLEAEELAKKEAEAKADGDKKKSKKDKEIRLINITNRTFNRIKHRGIVKVKESEADYYIENGFAYFDDEVVARKQDATQDNAPTDTAPTVGANVDDADNILNNL